MKISSPRKCNFLRVSTQTIMNATTYEIWHYCLPIIIARENRDFKLNMCTMGGVFAIFVLFFYKNGDFVMFNVENNTTDLTDYRQKKHP